MAAGYEVEGDVIRWRAPALLLSVMRIARIVTAVLAVVAAGLAVAVGDPASLTIGLILAALLAATGFAGHWHANRFLLEASPAGVYVRGTFSEDRFAWHEIQRMTVGYFGLQFELAGKFSVTSSAVQKSNIASARGRQDTRADEALEILQRCAYAITGHVPALASAGEQAKQRRNARLIMGAALAYIVVTQALKAI